MTLRQSGKSSVMSCPDVKLIPQTNTGICNFLDQCDAYLLIARIVPSFRLRIDNSGRSVICALALISRTV